jgi:aspartate/methionine/tyrosine aminotransferase
MKFDLGFGYPICVKEVLDLLYTPKVVMSPVMDMDYPEYEGKPDLINHIKKLTGKKHIIITNGATQAINIALRVLKKSENREVVVTNKYTFGYYPFMIDKANLTHIKTKHSKSQTKVINLIDMPSNPAGDLHDITDPFNNTIHDFVYGSKVYINTPFKPNIKARIEVGSTSKMFGISGVRIGWIATDIEADYKLFYEEIKNENCGTSVLSQDLVVDMLNKLDTDKFMTVAQGRINYNREEFLKLSNFFDGQKVNENGMFNTYWVDNKGLDIIDKSGVVYITLDEESKRKFIRFNLGANNTLTKQAINAIKLTDSIK